MKKILCPTDFSEGSRRAMREAVRLANEVDGELVLLHVSYVPPLMYSGREFVFPPHVMDGMSAEAKRGIDGAVREATALGAKAVTGKLAEGVPWIQIVDVLEHQGFDLCVMGTHGRTGLARVFLGSVAEKVVRHAPCSVMTMRPNGEPKPFVHVLVPTDFSESAEHALDIAAQLVSPGGSITLLHVIEAPVAFAGEVTAADFVSAIDKRAAESLAKTAARVTRVPIKTQSRIGYAGAQTLAALDGDPTIDLVVIGSHGRTGIKRALLGSVSEKIVRHAACPVLVAQKR